jgi:hypothetical protein
MIRLISYLTYLTLINICCYCQDVYEFRYIRQQGQDTYYGHGGAIAISEQQLITCAHLIDGQQQEIKIGDQWHKCEVKKIDKELDIALLQVTEKLKSIEIQIDKSMDKITVKMYPSQKFVKSEATLINKSGILYNYTAKGGSYGSSGGVAIKDDKCVGMIVANSAAHGLQIIDTVVVLPSRRILQFMKEQGDTP